MSCMHFSAIYLADRDRAPTTPYGVPVSVSEDFIVTTTVYRSLQVLHKIEKAPNGSRHITFGHSRCS